MKRVKMIALGMAVIVGGLTAQKKPLHARLPMRKMASIMCMWTGHLTGVSQFSKTTN